MFELDGLDLQELLQAEFTQLSATTRLFVASKGRLNIEGSTVDVHLAGAHAAGKTMGLDLVTGPYPAGQAVNGVVGDA